MSATQQAPRTGAPAQQVPGGAGTQPTVVVVGPRTRLGAALLDRRTGPALAVARHGADADALGAAGRDVLRVDASDVAARLQGAPSVEVAVCALGPVHPGPVDDLAADAATIERDLAVVRSVLVAAAGRPARVVLVSSVVALAPTPDRRYYGGLKGAVEQALVSLVAEHPGARLDVLYPGRLRAGAARGPAQLLSTGYDRVAALVDRALRHGGAAGRRRVVGLDARAWLVVRSLSLVVSGLRPGRVDPSRELARPPEVTS